MYRKFFKRPFDIVFALAGLLLSSPIFIIIYLLLMIQNRGDVFFFQKRPGLKTQPFSVIKFKTMNDKKDDQGILSPDNERITPFGDIIRKLSLDEIPQFINILKGDMSLIGPRPLLFKYVPLYSEVQLRRHEVRPGITGLAQVNGRNAISWTRKFELDVEYVNNGPFLVDLKIIFLTILKILRREGINQVSPGPFDGSN